MGRKYLWAPWRSSYILGQKEKGCIFCNRIKRKRDRKDLIAYRGFKNIVILNKFPYNSGHAMIVPNRHIASIGRLTDDEAIEFFDLIRKTVEVMKKVMHPVSFNIGMNLGQSSGAGIPTHLHMHVVPRWTGDTNFMPVIGETKVVSFDLDLTWKILKEGFDSTCPAEKSRPKRS
jgi:ATP adenylyltransferase